MGEQVEMKLLLACIAEPKRVNIPSDIVHSIIDVLLCIEEQKY